MSGEDKITAAHRARRAVLYLRQSSAGQVRPKETLAAR
jgi:hypothetical protein